MCRNRCSLYGRPVTSLTRIRTAVAPGRANRAPAQHPVHLGRDEVARLALPQLGPGALERRPARRVRVALALDRAEAERRREAHVPGASAQRNYTSFPAFLARKPQLRA